MGLSTASGFTVPPGSRRGVVPDRAAEAFARAMLELCPSDDLATVSISPARSRSRPGMSTARALRPATPTGGRFGAV